MESKSILSLQTAELLLQMVYWQGSASALVENDEMMKYVLFWLLEDPHPRLKTQHTPNEEAQVPEAEPPSDKHSEEV